MSELLTIGYEGTTLANVLAALRAAHVELLIDVRAVASSRKPGFSKNLLAASLADAGIGYLHLQSLGTPKEGRLAVRAGHPERMHAIFHTHMAADRPRAALAQAIAAARGQRACLLCFEHDHRTCHRALVAEMIQAETSQSVTHLHVAL
ncbi:MAG: DUF488 domain-containing protein [Acetobacteraceae bacterium]|nr:DUF488 domain-containing protein [Acetobacteraceae bacterium]